MQGPGAAWERDNGLRRARRIAISVGAAGAALTAVFAGVAASTLPGHATGTTNSASSAGDNGTSNPSSGSSTGAGSQPTTLQPPQQAPFSGGFGGLGPRIVSGGS